MNHRAGGLLYRRRQGGNLVAVRDANRDIHSDGSGLVVNQQGKTNHAYEDQHHSTDKTLLGALAHRLNAFGYGRWRCHVVASLAKLEKSHAV